MAPVIKVKELEPAKVISLLLLVLPVTGCSDPSNETGLVVLAVVVEPL